MDLEQVIHSRRAVREYTTETVGRPMLQALIEAAVQAPSAVNEQPWIFTVVQDRDRLALISREAKAHLLKAPPEKLALHRLRELRDDPDFDILYHAPVLIMIASATRGRWAVENCALAAENLMLTACAAGYGTCWIGLAQGWLATADGKAALRLPAECLPVAPIIVGRPKVAPHAVPRKEPRILWIDP
ncbi:MAG: nitroreductase [Proteobacteria bacterium]|nr:nitroreductase [Pseudomonadota bacterium]